MSSHAYVRNEGSPPDFDQPDHAKLIRSVTLPGEFVQLAMTLALALVSELVRFLASQKKMQSDHSIVSLGIEPDSSSPSGRVAGQTQIENAPSIMLVGGPVKPESWPVLGGTYQIRENRILIFWNRYFSKLNMIDYNIDVVYIMLIVTIIHELGHFRRMWTRDFDNLKPTSYAGLEGKEGNIAYREDAEEIRSRTGEALGSALTVYAFLQAKQRAGANVPLPRLTSDEETWAFLARVEAVDEICQEYLNNQNCSTMLDHLCGEIQRFPMRELAAPADAYVKWSKSVASPPAASGRRRR